MMALDGKTMIKEEIKDVYETATNGRNKGNGKDNCRAPDSPESARAVAPRSPMSPQIHHSSLAPPRPNRNASSSPIVNGATTTPPPATSAITPHLEQTRALGKIRKFLGSLVQFAQDTHPEVSDRIRALVLSIASGGITIEDFRIALQEATNLSLRPYVIPFLKAHTPLLQREIATLSRATNQTTLQYVTTNDSSVMEFSIGSVDHSEIFLPMETATNTVNGNNIVFKRRSSEALGDHHNGIQEWNDYIYPPTKRIHTHPALIGSSTNNIFTSQHPIFEYQGSSSSQSDGFGVLLDKSSHKEERETRSIDNQRRMIGGEEEWKSILTMLNCISAMVDKTKRAMTILQQRGTDSNPTINYSETAVAEIRRQTEEKVAEFKRNAEEAVNQVKRQAVIEIQRAVAAAESRAVEMMAQERLKMEKFFAEMNKNLADTDVENKSPTMTASQNACWNCGRKANETCSGCNLARYCGSFCQHKDWEHHHQICGNQRPEFSAAMSSKISSQSVRNPLSRASPTQSQATPSNVGGTSGGSTGNLFGGTQGNTTVTNGINSVGSTK